jgi:hypothetical protein
MRRRTPSSAYRLASSLALAMALSACGASYETIRARAAERASFDLSCPATALSITQLGDTTRLGMTPQSPGIERTVVGVVGCGQKAVYVVECATGSCNAQLNADTKPTTPH